MKINREDFDKLMTLAKKGTEAELEQAKTNANLEQTKTQEFSKMTVTEQQTKATVEIAKILGECHTATIKERHKTMRRAMFFALMGAGLWVAKQSDKNWLDFYSKQFQIQRESQTQDSQLQTDLSSSNTSQD